MRRAVVLSLLLSIVATPAFSYGKGEGTQEVQIDRKVKREFFLSLRSGDFSKAKELIASGKVPVDFRNKFKQTPLYYAADNDDPSFAKFLVEHGANVNARDLFGITPLHEAVIRGSYRVAKFLIEKGADVNAKDNYGNTPLHYCATTFGTAPVAKVLLQNGGDPNVKNNRGKTPLELANEVKNFPVAKLMTKVIQKRR